MYREFQFQWGRGDSDVVIQGNVLSQLVKADFPVVTLDEPASLQQAYLGLLRGDAGASREGS